MSSPDLLNRQISPRVLWMALVFGLVLAGNALQSQVHLNHDVSWFVHFPRWLLQGRSLGVDLHDGNLPMVWGVFLPASALAEASLLSEATAVRLVFWAYFLLVGWLTSTVLFKDKSVEQSAAVGWITAFVLVATLTPGFSFGQREHVSVLFLMPYLAMATVRLGGGHPGRLRLLICVGVLAGVGCSIKPYFLAIPGLVELLLLARLGWEALLTRAESLSLATTVALYVLGSLVFLGDYLRFTIGMTMAGYWAYDTDNFPFILDRYTHAAVPLVGGLMVALVTRSWSRHQTVMLVAFVGYSIAYFVQSKGFVYHAYPVFVCAAIFLGISLARGVAQAWGAWQVRKRALEMAALVVAIAIALVPIKQAHDDVVRWYFTYNISHGPVGQFRQTVIEVVNQFAPDSTAYFFAFSTHPFPGFPTASYSRADYAGRTIVQQFIPAYARLDEVKDPDARARVVAAAEYQRGTVIEDFQRRPPTVVFAEAGGPRLGMNGRSFDDIAFYLKDPRFREIWASYEEYPPLGPLRIFVLRAKK